MTGRIAFQGELGAYSHQACRQARPDMEAVPCATFEDTIELCRRGDTDLAMLKVDAKGLPAIAWDTSKPEVGDWVATAGPTDVPASVGVVSVLARGVSAPRGLLGVGLEQGEGAAKVREVLDS